MTTLSRLIDFLPTYFNTDPLKQVGFALVYDDDSVRMIHTVKDGVISARTFQSFKNDFEVTLEGKTLSQVAAEINAVAHYMAVVPTIMQSVNALSLMEVEDVTGENVYVFTNTTWGLFAAIAMELDDARRAGEEMLRHMSVPGATDIALDYWCEFFNNRRKIGEVDTAFGVRTINEIKQPKSNNFAMEIILEQFYGYEIRVIDLDYLQASEMLMNNISTPVHNKQYPIKDSNTIGKELATFGLIFPNGTIIGWNQAQWDELQELVYRIKAAGTRPKCFWRDVSNNLVSQYL